MEPSPNTPRRVLRGDLFLPEGPAAQDGPIYGVEEAFGMPKEGLMPSGPGQPPRLAQRVLTPVPTRPPSQEEAPLHWLVAELGRTSQKNACLSTGYQCCLKSDGLANFGSPPHKGDM